MEHAHPAEHGHHGDQAADTPQSHGSHHAHMVADFRRRFWVSLILTVPVLLLAPLIQDALNVEEAWNFTGDSFVLWLLASIVFVYGGWPFLTGIVSELRERLPGMMTLIAVAITVAYVYSTAVVFGVSGDDFFWETATLIDVMLLGHWLEMRSIMGASRALEALAELVPSDAHLVSADGAVRDVPVESLVPGDRVQVRPGERVPADGVVVDGRSSVDEAMLTGESMPVEKAQDAEVIGGSINGTGALVVEVRRTGAETYLAQVIELVREAQETKSRTQRLADRAALWLTVIALSAGVGTLSGWLLTPEGANFAFQRAVTVTIITCPHALGLAIPLAVSVSTSISARAGVLVRDRAGFERARLLDAVVFDKTGTLTEGRFGVVAVVPADGRDEAQVMRLAAGVEAQSEHPLARGIVAAFEARGEGLPPAVRDFSALPGRGAQATIDGALVQVVSPGFLAEAGISLPPGVESDAARTLVHVLVDGAPAGTIALGDVIREESRAAVDGLKALGIRVMMLTGDTEAVAASVARELGLDEYFAEVLPHEKAATIRGLRERGLTVAMVGDGVNDAPALVEADVGIAIGTGTDVAVESADIVLVRSDVRAVEMVARLSRATYRKMIQNLWWATGYNVLAIPLAAGVLAPFGFVMPPAIGAALMSVSTVIVAANAQLLRREERRFNIA